MEGGFVRMRPLRPLEAVRAFGVMLGGSIALAAAAAVSSVAVARAFMSVRRHSPLALFGAAGTALDALVIRPWHLRWGAEPEDGKRPMPGDELVTITVSSPDHKVWWRSLTGKDASVELIVRGRRRTGHAVATRIGDQALVRVALDR